MSYGPGPEFAAAIHEMINGVIIREELNYAEVIGILEMVKLTVMEEALYDTGEDD